MFNYPRKPQFRGLKIHQKTIDFTHIDILRGKFVVCNLLKVQRTWRADLLGDFPYVVGEHQSLVRCRCAL